MSSKQQRQQKTHGSKPNENRPIIETLERVEGSSMKEVPLDTPTLCSLGVRLLSTMALHPAMVFNGNPSSTVFKFSKDGKDEPVAMITTSDVSEHESEGKFEHIQCNVFSEGKLKRKILQPVVEIRKDEYQKPDKDQAQTPKKQTISEPGVEGGGGDKNKASVTMHYTFIRNTMDLIDGLSMHPEKVERAKKIYGEIRDVAASKQEDLKNVMRVLDYPTKDRKEYMTKIVFSTGVSDKIWALWEELASIYATDEKHYVMVKKVDIHLTANISKKEVTFGLYVYTDAMGIAETYCTST